MHHVCYVEILLIVVPITPTPPGTCPAQGEREGEVFAFFFAHVLTLTPPLNPLSTTLLYLTYNLLVLN